MKKTGNKRIMAGLEKIRDGIRQAKITAVSDSVGFEEAVVRDVLLFYPKPILEEKVDDLIIFFNKTYQG